MVIAVTYENGEIFQHFGHTSQFKLYEVTDKTVTNTKVVDTEGSGHGALAEFLKAQGADAVICGGIGAGAQNALGEAGIEVYGGVSGDCDEAVNSLVKGTLEFSTNATCNHHHDHDHEEGHTCGNHGCGGNH